VKSPSSFLTVVVGVVIAFVGAATLRTGAQMTPPPPPPPLGSSIPTPSATLGPIANPSGTPSPSPPPDARKGIEGVWEVQIQHMNSTDYTHFKLAQTGNALTGTYLDHGKKYPLSGSLDGQDVRLIVSMPNGTTMLLEGRLDGTTDMIGLLTTDKEQVPFTAAYRAKEKWIENVNAAPGGLGAPNGGGYTPP
jgi:hypothetical protein